MSLFRNSRELQFRTSKLWQTINRFREQRRGACFYRGKEELRRGVMVLHWLQPVGSLLLMGQKEIFLPAVVFVRLFNCMSLRTI